MLCTLAESLIVCCSCKALSSERTASYRQLEANLAKANAEKADLADRVKTLEIRLEEVIPRCILYLPELDYKHPM